MTASVAPGESTDYADPFDDIFGSAPPSPTAQVSGTEVLEGRSQHPSDPSDIPRLRSIHVTNGYREGIAASKEKYVQEGFDEGYVLGAELGMKAGWCLGALEGIWHALQPSVRDAAVESKHPRRETRPTRDGVRELLAQAEQELTITSLWGKEYVDSDGIWLYEVSAKGDDETVTFREVAEAHPLLKKWKKAVVELADTAGLHLRSEDK